jgi:tetratricopeptide (TPR) repeat protein
MRRTIALSILLIAAAATNAFAGAEGRMAGKVIDAATKAPIAGATITVSAVKGAGRSFTQKYTSEKDGSYAIFLLDATIKYDFLIEAPGYQPQTMPAQKLQLGQTTLHDIEMPPVAAATPAVAKAAAPDPAVVAYNEGAALANEGKVDEAIAKIEEAMKLRADLPAGPGALAHLYLRSKNYPKAIENATKALTIDADDMDMNSILADAYNATGDKAKAAEYTAKLPANPATMFNQAVPLLNKGDYAGAEPILKKVVAADPKFARAWYQLGIAGMQRGDTAAARTAFEKYLELDPKGTDADVAREALKSLK